MILMKTIINEEQIIAAVSSLVVALIVRIVGDKVADLMKIRPKKPPPDDEL